MKKGRLCDCAFECEAEFYTGDDPYANSIKANGPQVVIGGAVGVFALPEAETANRIAHLLFYFALQILCRRNGHFDVAVFPQSYICVD